MSLCCTPGAAYGTWMRNMYSTGLRPAAPPGPEGPLGRRRTTAGAPGASAGAGPPPCPPRAQDAGAASPPTAFVCLRGHWARPVPAPPRRSWAHGGAGPLGGEGRTQEKAASSCLGSPVERGSGSQAPPGAGPRGGVRGPQGVPGRGLAAGGGVAGADPGPGRRQPEPQGRGSSPR